MGEVPDELRIILIDPDATPYLLFGSLMPLSESNVPSRYRQCHPRTPPVGRPAQGR